MAKRKWFTAISLANLSVNLLRLFIPPGGMALSWGIFAGLATNFLNAPWYVHAAVLFGLFVLFWFLTWLYFPLVVRWNYKKRGLLTMRATLPSFEDELPESDRVWALWYNAGNALGENVFQRFKKPQRLVLLDPASPFLEFHAKLYGGEIDSHRTSIRDAQKAAEKWGIEVKTWPGPLPFTLTIFDPESMNGRIRVEFPIPDGPLGRRPSFTVFRRTDPNVYSDLLAFFRRAIGDDAT